MQHSKTVLIIGLTLFCTFSGVQAQLKWPQKSHKVQAGFKDETVTIQYNFHNPGKYPVKITKVLTGCGCLEANTDKNLIKPGEKGVITAIFAVGDRQGKQNKTIEVITDDQRSDINLNLTIAISPPLLTVSPRVLHFKKGKENTKSINVTTRKPGHLKVTKVSSSVKGITSEIHSSKSKDSYHIVISAPANFSEKKAIITISTNSKSASYQSFPVLVVFR